MTPLYTTYHQEKCSLHKIPFHTMKLGGITAFYAVVIKASYCSYSGKSAKRFSKSIKQN